MHFASIAFCDVTEEQRSRYPASLRRLVTWSQNLSPAEKQKYGSCLTKGLSKAMVWSFCCGEASKHHLLPVMKLWRDFICHKEEDRESTICRFLAAMSDDRNLDGLFGIIDRFNICECPVDLSPIMNDVKSLPRTERFARYVKNPKVKRQFDAVSTAMIFSDIMCDRGRDECKIHSPAQVKTSLSKKLDDRDPERQFEGLVFIGRDVICCFVG